ncbi:MAG: AraC family transcriptional regulator [Gammaproteobacteria bacterium]|nr:AraC family transcriptional regulator [Gammaproteobacteria bacterium]NND38281.1 helix-turn-helix domain-containing protein [Pseudomonadales bacterium]MBT8151292.1 AraC family transcriptional regulator [Gammaproteobacteria bacterium]NNL10591.1 helix-turn-helix domain-containing protein [Pseudomonadales bacterium]NNM11491.1 helix-turn-helix domain-containing protein [Pseudomonadales bacterium]
MVKNKLYFSATYARLLARGSYAETGICGPEQLLDGAGLSMQELQQADYLDWQVVRRIMRNIDKSGAQRDWPVKFASQLTLASHGPMGFTALSAPSLANALEVLVAYHPTRIATIEASLGRDPDQPARQRLYLRELTGDLHHGRQVMEIATRVTLTLIEALVGHALGSNVEVHFAYPEPDADIGMRATSGVGCTFNAAQNFVEIPASWLQMASPLYDNASYHANLLKCREQMSALLSMQANTVEWVRQRLAQNFDRALAENRPCTNLPDLSRCAEALHMSGRTLSRKLADHQTSFSQILADVRREYAAQMLEGSYLPVAEIGQLLGYSDAANFVRAHRAWRGCTPAAWRKQLKRAQ